MKYFSQDESACDLCGCKCQTQCPKLECSKALELTDGDETTGKGTKSAGWLPCSAFAIIVFNYCLLS